MAKLIKGINDLYTVSPALSSEWNYGKNGDLSPTDVTAGSGKKVWWIGACGHEWQAQIKSRLSGKSCPYCSNVKLLSGFNDLQSKKIELVEEWNWNKNVGLGPSDVLFSSHKHVWWKCSECGYEWNSEVRSRAIYNQGCPECAKEKRSKTFRKNLLLNGKKSFVNEYPNIVKEWNYEKNTGLCISDYTSNSSKKVWWKCSKCEYEWTATIKTRTYNNSGCPFCAGKIIKAGINDLESLNPSLAREWHPLRNGLLKPNGVSVHSGKLVWWKCKYGHEYKCRIADRTKGIGCSVCSKHFKKSFPEQIVYYYISKYFDTISNYRALFLGRSEIDIYIPELNVGIEYDGYRYHKDIERDKKKDDLCFRNGIQLYRVRENRCPVYNRIGDTFILDDDSDNSFTKVIEEVLMKLGVKKIDVDVSRDKQIILETYRDTVVSGSIAEDYPYLAEEWNYLLNGELKPENIPSTKSKEKYYWLCKKCGYSWKAQLYERISGTGCPACAGKVVVAGINDLASTNPLLVKEWNYEKNGDLKPDNVSKGSEVIVWWKCSVCSNEWRAKIKKRVAGSGCNKCAQNNRAKKQYKPVYQFTIDGVLLKKYACASMAAQDLGISKSSIQHVCSGIGNMKTAGGFIWRYSKNVTEQPKSIGRKCKSVIQFDNLGNIIKKYDSVKEAAKEVSVSETSIRQACNGTYGRKTAGGYIWSYDL